MATEDLRDSGGRLLGRIETRSDGKQDGRDESGRLKGTYDPHSNETRDASGRLVAKGNMLSSLITSSN